MSFATSESVGDLNEFMLQFGVNGEQSKTEFHVEYPSFKRPRKDEIASSRVGMPVVANKLIPCNVFKTKMCEQFRLGCCIYGDKCTYAHGIGDIRKPVPHCEGLVQGDHYVKIWDEEPRMKVCTIFYRGEMCPYGDRCHFLHKGPNKFRKDSGRIRQRFARSIAATGCSRGPITGSDSACTNRSLSDHVAECKGYGNLSLNADCLYPKPIYWKTKLCHKWETTGDCSYGEKCIFAHGKAELKNLGRYSVSDFGKINTSATRIAPATDSSPSETATSSSFKCLSKLKDLEKISGIYADWVDDIPLVHSLPSKIQT